MLRNNFAGEYKLSFFAYKRAKGWVVFNYYWAAVQFGKGLINSRRIDSFVLESPNFKTKFYKKGRLLYSQRLAGRGVVLSKEQEVQHD